MNVADIYTDGFTRIRDRVHGVLKGIDQSVLAERITPDANSIAWLLWHLTRIQDDHVAQAFGAEQRWIEDGFVKQFSLPLDELDTGYGHSSDEVASLGIASSTLLVEYHNAVFSTTTGHLKGVTDTELDRVVDQWTDGPVSLGVRLVSVLGDNLQHVGQAAYLRGLPR